MRPIRTMSRTPRMRRIAFKMTLIAATTMIAFNFVTPSLRNWAYESFDFAGRFEPIPGLAEIEEEWLGGDPGAEVLRRRGLALAERVARNDSLLVLIDDEGLILFASADLAVQAGEPWPAPYDSRFRLEENGREIGLAVANWSPVRSGRYRGAQIAIIQCVFDNTWDETDGPTRLGLESDNGLRAGARARTQELEDAAERFRLLRKGIELLVSILTALLFSGAVTLLVTRRLRKLARQAARPPADKTGVPGPFAVSGRDEVAFLANTLNGMRTRVIESIESLEHRDELRREWIAQVSHDLRTPLTALLACIERARSRLEQGDRAGVEESLSLAVHDLGRVRTLSDDLLEIARLEIDDSLALEPTLPIELMRQASRGLVPLAERRGVTLEVLPAERLPELLADGHRLMRAAENLLRNAIRHATSRVVFEARRVDDVVRFAVRDDGRGFEGEPSNYLREDRRFRLARGDSAGLGLVVTRKIAEAHGGRIGARNLEEGGAEVWFTVPVPASPEG
ncbi:MAG: HAMP domain-containing sensor histidine kinase [Planctomycetota bacterium]